MAAFAQSHERLYARILDAGNRLHGVLLVDAEKRLGLGSVNGNVRNPMSEAQSTSKGRLRPPRNFVAEPFEYHQEVELEIHDLNNLGVGVGRIDGWVVMVPYSLPGERVRARIWRNKTNYSDADLVEVLLPSTDRVEPCCPLFKRCGGCQYQHISLDGQLSWKTAQVRDLLKRLAGLEIDVRRCIGSEQAYEYRSKITPHFRRNPVDPKVPIGFQMADSRNVIDVPQCPIATPEINEALREQRELIRRGIRKFKKGGTLLLRHSSEGVVTDMKAVTSEVVEGVLFQYVAGEFFQNNPYVLPKLIRFAVEQAAATGLPNLIDAYCGVGVFGIHAATRFEQVYGVEVSRQAVTLAEVNAEGAGVGNISFLAASAEEIFNRVPVSGDSSAVLLDPPRKGCDETFLQQLFAFAPARVVYVSCGPDTQARDLKSFLDQGYAVECVQPFDLFPQTRHIENVVVLRRA